MSEHPPIDGAEFRRVLGRYPTGVTLVTADDDGPVAMVIGSFGSVSLDPPLVQFMPAKTSSTWPRIERSGHYCVNVLGADHLDLCNSFFRKDGDPFEAISWHAGPSGSPVIENIHAWIDCRIRDVHDAGDHWIVVGEVMALDAGDDGSPLVFHQGGYHTVGPIGGD